MYYMGLIFAIMGVLRGVIYQCFAYLKNLPIFGVGIVKYILIKQVTLHQF